MNAPAFAPSRLRLAEALIAQGRADEAEPVLLQLAQASDAAALAGLDAVTGLRRR